ncbi:MAG: hypothetical protein SFX18_07675 [Pirellulales bacterium]|nr:hypothetical protein [Pirellulales bacterium]
MLPENPYAAPQTVTCAESRVGKQPETSQLAARQLNALPGLIVGMRFCQFSLICIVLYPALLWAGLSYLAFKWEVRSSMLLVIFLGIQIHRIVGVKKMVLIGVGFGIQGTAHSLLLAIYGIISFTISLLMTLLNRIAIEWCYLLFMGGFICLIVSYFMESRVYGQLFKITGKHARESGLREFSALLFVFGLLLTGCLLFAPILKNRSHRLEDAIFYMLIVLFLGFLYWIFIICLTLLGQQLHRQLYRLMIQARDNQSQP